MEGGTEGEVGERGGGWESGRQAGGMRVDG